MFAAGLALIAPPAAGGGGSSTTITIGGRAGNTFSGMQDALMIADFGLANTNLSTEEGSQGYPFLLRPDLSGIPGGKTITDAFWTFQVVSGGGSALTPVMRKMLRAWVEAQATANNWSSGNAWTTQNAAGDGTDRDAAANSTFSYPGGFAVNVDIATTSNTGTIAYIQAVVGGATNNGQLFEPHAGFSLALPGAANAAIRPFLTITYT